MVNAIDISLVMDSNRNINLEVAAQGQIIKGIVNHDQLLALKNTIELILNPEREFESHLKSLKEFKRQVYTGWMQAVDPKIKAEKWALYISTKTLVSELDNRKKRK